MARWILIPLFLTLTLLGCQPGRQSTSGKLRIVTTTSIIADLVSQIGGEHVSVSPIMPPGIDPHRYTPLPGDTVKLAEADLVFFNGLHLEGKMVDVLEKASINGRSPIAVTKTMSQADIRSEGQEADPHVWFDVSRWTKTIDPVVDALCEADSKHAETYRANAERYRKTLVDLHNEVISSVNTLPKEKRVLITSHDAFGYFAEAYGFEVHGLQGVSTASEVGIEDRRQLADLLIAKNVSAVFGETSVPTKGLQSVLDTVRSKTNRSIRLIGGSDALYSDSLGPVGSAGATYVGMVRHNVSVIVEALKP